ncbi:MAG: menaquinone biosynthesis protein [Spirochaetota bacterium]
MMRIGLVKHFNARPLTYGFEEDKSKYDLYYDNPSILKDMLLRGELDTALISSVECWRNRDTLGFSKTTGVCASERVRSILFYHNRKESYPPEKVYVDSGSRTSVALLKVLLQLSVGKIPEMISQDPSYIFSMLNRAEGYHMLFGDNALLARFSLYHYYSYDLATWWNKETGKSFCFAFWAFPLDKPIPDAFFEESLERGLDNIRKIIRHDTRLPREVLYKYLSSDLHYYVREEDYEGFELFSEYCREYDIL